MDCTYEEECANCGALNEVEEEVSGECERCGIKYIWEELYDEDKDESRLYIRWTDSFIHEDEEDEDIERYD